MSEKKNRRSITSLKLFQDLIIKKDEENSSEDLSQKSALIKKKEMISFKILQNLDLTTYDYILLDRQFCNKTLQDFASFKTLLEEIKQQFKPELLNYRNIQQIKAEGKFCFNKYNITKLIPFNDKKLKNEEISPNSKYIRTYDMKFKSRHFYTTKSFFKGKHCFEIEILQTENFEISFGILNIDYIDVFKKEFCKSKNNELTQKTNFPFMSHFECFKLKSPIFMKKNNKSYHHYISYEDILGFCFDLDKKLLYLYLNGELINTYALNVVTGTNISFVPIISLGKFSEIIFNPGANLKFIEDYENMGFVPLDGKNENNYEKSKLINITNEYINILFNNGKSIINNKNITYSDINEIYHDIFDFLGNVSFQHSYIIDNCFIKNIELDNKNDFFKNDDLEFYYICIKYILNSVKAQKTLLSNIIQNIVESIHIYLKKGEIFFIKLLQLLAYLFSKNDMINIISKFSKKIIMNLFSQIFVPLCPFKNLFQKISLDFIVASNHYLVSRNSTDIYDTNIFRDTTTDFPTFCQNIFLAQCEYDKYNMALIFNIFVELILKSGIEIEENKNANTNCFLLKQFKDYFSMVIKRVCGTVYNIGEKEFNNIFKTFFIPAMLLFNNNINKKEQNNLISFAINKYLTDDGKEKLGGTMKYINENYVKEIQNFEEISKMKINSANNVFILLFLDYFFCIDEAGVLWVTLDNMIMNFKEFCKQKFYNTTQKNSYEFIHNKLIKFIEFKLSFPNLEEIEIFVNFLKNFADFIITELYPKKIIYFLPEKMFYQFKRVIYFLKAVLIRLFSSHEMLFDYNVTQFDKKIQVIDVKNKEKELENLCKKCLGQYISILAKTISDKNIKKIMFKCEILGILQLSIEEEEYFTDEEIYNIFNFLNEIHNDIEYKKWINDFMKIFDNQVIIKENTFTNLGKRLNKLFEIKENNNLIRTILILLYSNMNASLSKLEEIFAEYKFRPRPNGFNNMINNLNINDDNADNNNNEEGDNNNEGNNFINNLGNFFFGIFDARIFNPNVRGNHVIAVINRNPRRNIQQLSDKEKLDLLNDYLKDTYLQFVKLINFYKLSAKVNELYDFNSFENKYLNNLLISLYNIVFSSTNSAKISDNYVINSYKRLTEIILKFYSTIFKNISELNKENILKDFAQRRNIYHLKEIGEFFNKQFEPKKGEKNIDNKAKLFNDFLTDLEKLVPEELTMKLMNIKSTPGNSEVKLDEKNLCQICADSVIDTHIVPCDHSICRNCLFQCLSGNKLCPFCRVQIQGIKEDKDFKI